MRREKWLVVMALASGISIGAALGSVAPRVEAQSAHRLTMYQLPGHCLYVSETGSVGVVDRLSIPDPHDKTKTVLDSCVAGW